jgi:hypothetical protein
MNKMLKSIVRKVWPKAFYRKPRTWIYGSDRVWTKQDRFHRRHGPAVEYSNGIKSWYYEGVHYLYEDSFGFMKITEGDRVLRR